MMHLALGTVQLGMFYGYANQTGMPSDDQAMQVLDAAMACGVHTWDTARAYGCSEARLGHWQQANQAKINPITAPRIITKLCPTACDAQSVLESLQASAAALQQTRLDTVLLHRASQLTGPVIEAMERARETGLLRCWGVSVCSPAELEAAMAQPAVTAIQLPLNVLDWRWHESGAWSALCEKQATKGYALYFRSLYLQGVLLQPTEKWPRVPELAGGAAIAQDLSLILRDYPLSNTPLSVALLAGVLALCQASNVTGWLVLGAENHTQVAHNAQAFGLAQQQVEGAFNAILAWQQRFWALPVRAPETLLNPALWPC